MNPNEYQKLALRTANKDPEYPRIINGVLGLAGEAGECADIVKKHLFQGHELNKEKLLDEIGDVLWYCAYSADALGLQLEDIMQHNIDKLAKRYPEGFAADKSINRKI